MKNPGVNFSARLSVRDFFLLLSLLGVGGNAYWCYQHQKDIDKLKAPAQTVSSISPSGGK